jgi:hypothetical protein
MLLPACLMTHDVETQAYKISFTSFSTNDIKFLQNLFTAITGGGYETCDKLTILLYGVFNLKVDR